MNINTGDTAFVLICAAMVCFMTPGLAFFYGGPVRKKNVLTIMMQNFISMGIVTLVWVLGGFSLAFGKDINTLESGEDVIQRHLNKIFPALSRRLAPQTPARRPTWGRPGRHCPPGVWARRAPAPRAPGGIRAAARRCRPGAPRTGRGS